MAFRDNNFSYIYIVYHVQHGPYRRIRRSGRASRKYSRVRSSADRGKAVPADVPVPARHRVKVRSDQGQSDSRVVLWHCLASACRASGQSKVYGCQRHRATVFHAGALHRDRSRGRRWYSLQAHPPPTDPTVHRRVHRQLRDYRIGALTPASLSAYRVDKGVTAHHLDSWLWSTDDPRVPTSRFHA